MARRRRERIQPEERSLLSRWAYWLGERGEATLAELRSFGRGAIGEVVARLRAARSAEPPVRMCWRWAYAVEWWDDATGERVASTRVEAETEREDQRQSAYAKARRLALKLPTDTSVPREAERARLTMRLRRIASPIRVPCV